MGKSGLGLEIWSLHLWGGTYRGVGGLEEIWYPLTVYKAVKADSESDASIDLVLSNSYDLCTIRCETDGSKQILVAEVNEAQKEV